MYTTQYKHDLINNHNLMMITHFLIGVYAWNGEYSSVLDETAC